MQPKHRSVPKCISNKGEVPKTSMIQSETVHGSVQYKA